MNGIILINKLSRRSFLNIKMSVNSCRVCGNKFFKEPLLRYENMPKAAQHLPTADLVRLEKGIDLEVYQCSGCGLVQLSNEPVSYYKEVIRASAFSEEMKKFRIQQFSDFVTSYSLKNKKVIEVGCGRGEYLSLMKQFGIDAYGLEYAMDSVEHCVQDGLTVSRKYIENSDEKIGGGPFDAFFILNFFEHIPDPNTMLAGVYNNLTDDGIGLVEVPNFNMMLENNLFSEFVGDHLFYFTTETLSSTLSQNGFEIVECKEIWYDYIISAVIRKRKKLDVSGFSTQQDKIQNEIEKYIKRFKRVAVWGAGHQSFAILSLTKISDKIDYVVDDATFKQNNFTPATHVPIVSSGKLRSNPVDAIIVMAASYSDEVAKKIRENFDNDIHVSILRDFGLEEK